MVRTRNWIEWAIVFGGCAGADVPFVHELIDLVEADGQSPHSDMLLNPDHAAASRPLYWKLLMDLQIKRFVL